MWRPGTEKPSSAVKVCANAANDEKKKEEKEIAKKNLSNKTLAMKFMQRKGVIVASRLAQKEANKDIWKFETSPVADGLSIICEPDVPDPSIPSIFGRRSFGNFNKNIQDEYRSALRKLKFAYVEEKVVEDEISAEEMTNRMIKYTGIRGKILSNKPRKKQKSNQR